MGWCHEFGPQIHEGCAHPMVAGADACTCAECGVVCRGRFNGCAAVWERGPLAIAPAPAMPVSVSPPAPVVRTPTVVQAPPVINRPPVVVAESAPVLYYERPAARPTRVVPAPVAGLTGLRDRLDALRLEVKLLGEAVGDRIGRLPAPSRERG